MVNGEPVRTRQEWVPCGSDIACGLREEQVWRRTEEEGGNDGKEINEDPLVVPSETFTERVRAVVSAVV